MHSQFEQTDALWLADECNNKRVNASNVLQAKNQPFHMSHSGINWQAEARLYWHTFLFLLSFSPSFPSLWVPHSISHFCSFSLQPFKPLCLSLNSMVDAVDP